MILFIAEIFSGNANTIEIPITSDSIFLLPILIGLGLTISCSQYIFKELKERKFFIQSKNQIKNQLEIEEFVQERSPKEKTILNKLSTFSYPQLAGLGSLAFLVLGGSGLLVLQANQQNLPHIPKTSDLNNSTKVKSTKSESLTFNPQNMSISRKKEVEKITYISPSLSRLTHSRNKEDRTIKPMKNLKFDF
tara:strand:- start:15 stop:590 length:576 start_codon:yes stop_codon:yes gene_type:complete